MLTQAQSNLFTTRMSTRFRAIVRNKAGAVAMIAAAGVLGTMHLAGAATPTAGEFLSDFSTTIPDPEEVLEHPLHPMAAIYLDEHARATPDAEAIAMTHECHHAERVDQGWPSAQWYYAVDDNSRAEEEVQAYVAAESVSRRLTGVRRAFTDVQASLARSYHLNANARQLALALLEDAWASLEGDRVVPPITVAVVAHEILDGLGVGWAS